ncbi:MAG: 4Fe-4S binding protein [Oscillospiraceae bacterium]|jgi:Fe-S-cluster-containing hydrogenase component 2|nr:4Fe-4S binding protein [Oscillospiraceae bacterium]
MKKLATDSGSHCMACLACEMACSEAFYKVADPRLSCIRIGEKNGKAKASVCVQCGACARACAAGAITQNPKGVYMVNKQKCEGCGKCAEACPFNVMVWSPERGVPGKCIACGICVKACPMELLYIKETDVTKAG